jgi:hypothetical protein
MSKISLAQRFFLADIKNESTSAADRHRFDANPDPD